jgi:uncharacterized lipoprotein
MHVIVKSLLLVAFLVSCGTTEESRYRDTGDLERPPVVTTTPSREQRVVDTSSIPKRKDNTGLGSDVYQNSPTQLTIRQSFGDAWNTLSRALKQSGIKITDHERDKGLYYVTQKQDTDDSEGFFAKATAFLSADPTIYLLTVKQEGVETTVTATVANAAEQSSAADKDGAPESTTESPAELLQLLFNTLRDKLEEE